MMCDLMTFTYKKIWQISYPILTGMIIQQLIGLTDTAFLGRLGKIELGASAIAAVFYVMIFMLGQGFSIGAQILIAQHNGEGRFKRIGQIFYQGIFFLLISAVFIIAGIRFFADTVLAFIISSPLVLQAASDYLYPRSFGFVFSFAIVMFRALYIGTTHTKVLSLNAYIMLLVNVVLDYLLIFGHCGCPKLGIAGAAIASVAAEASSAVFFLIYTFSRFDYKKFGLDIPYFRNLKTLKRVLNISVWTILQNVVSLSTWLFFMLAVEHIGENELAISNILRSVSALPFMIVNALLGATNAITGNLYGAGDTAQIKPTTFRIINLGYFGGLIAILLLVISPFWIMRIYTDDINLIDQAISAYYASMTSYFTLVPGFVFMGVISGIGHTKMAMYLELLALVAYTITVWIIVIVFRADIAVCWLTDHSYNLVLWFGNYFYICRKNWFKS